MVTRYSPHPFYLSLLVLAACCLFFLGCSIAALRAPNDDESFIRLSRANGRPIQLRLTYQPLSPRLGHQFVLLLLPFGRIELEQPENFFLKYAARSMAITGYSPSAGPNLPQLHVEIIEASLTAYDLFFVRRIAAHLMARATLLSRQGEILSAAECRHEAASYEPFAFEPELSALYGRAAEEMFADLFGRLHFSRAFRAK